MFERAEDGGEIVAGTDVLTAGSDIGWVPV
jgi:hypothetical protein